MSGAINNLEKNIKIGWHQSARFKRPHETIPQVIIIEEKEDSIDIFLFVSVLQ